MPANRVPNKQLYPYGTLAFPLAAAFIVLQVLVPTHYAETTGLSLSVIGIALLVARLFDMVSDPIVGLLSDKTPEIVGRRKIWIVAAAPFLAYSCFKLFNPAADANLTYLLGWSIAVYAFGTMTIIPLNAWGAELSPDYNERSRITGVRAGFGLVGTLCALLLPALFSTEGNTNLGPSLVAITWLVIISMSIATVVSARFVPDSFPIIMPTHSIRDLIGLLLKPSPLRVLIISFLFNGIGNAIPATLFLLYVTHVLDAADKAGQLLLLYFVCAAISIPLWIMLCQRFEKHSVWIFAIIIASLFFVWTPFLGQGDLPYFALIVAATGFAAGADLTIPTSINGDLIEWDLHNTGFRRPGLFFALWGTTTKLAFALAIGIAFPLLEISGFSVGESNTENANLGLAILYGLPCIAFKLAAAFLMRNYPITRKTHTDIRNSLAKG